MTIEIGDKVRKKSNKPFKSGKKVNTISGFTTNPHIDNCKAYSFEEDDSVVNMDRCTKVGDIKANWHKYYK